MKIKSKILLIDDEPQILDALGGFLGLEGFEVFFADNGEKAIEMMQHQTFDAVVCDYMMPQMNGIKLLKNLRERRDYTPFVFFSGNANDSHRVNMSSLGAYEFVEKPYIELLPDVLRRMIKLNEAVKVLNPTATEKDEFLDILYSVGK
jgi:DNA-binding NtrC family response regulator